MVAYNVSNIFAKILRQEVDVPKIYEDEWVLVFPDINPRAPIHLLIIPKGPYSNAHEFYQKASSEEIIALARATAHVVTQHHLETDGYRLIANSGPHGGQEVPHFHIHLLGGKMLKSASLNL